MDHMDNEKFYVLGESEVDLVLLVIVGIVEETVFIEVHAVVAKMDICLIFGFLFSLFYESF